MTDPEDDEFEKDDEDGMEGDAPQIKEVIEEREKEQN